MNMREKMAGAANEAWENAWENTHETEYIPVCLVMVDAILDAMREPSDAVMGASGWSLEAWEFTKEDWQAMIDAIKEGK
jgi:hypothetical protein